MIDFAFVALNGVYCSLSLAYLLYNTSCVGMTHS